MPIFSRPPETACLEEVISVPEVYSFVALAELDGKSTLWGESDSSYSVDVGDTLIARLLNSCGPSAVLRVVASIIVNTVKAVLVGWSAAHIGKKVVKRVIPPIADSYAPAAVVGIALCVRVVAAFAKMNPAAVFWYIGRSHFLTPSKVMVRGLGISVPSAPNYNMEATQ